MSNHLEDIGNVFREAIELAAQKVMAHGGPEHPLRDLETAARISYLSPDDVIITRIAMKLQKLAHDRPHLVQQRAFRQAILEVIHLMSLLATRHQPEPEQPPPLPPQVTTRAKLSGIIDGIFNRKRDEVDGGTAGYTGPTAH